MFAFDNPPVAYKGDRATIITGKKMKDKNGNESLIVVGVWKAVTLEGDKVNLIKSVYPLDDISKLLTKYASENLIITKKEKAKNILETIGLQLPEVLNILSLSKSRISQKNSVVNSNYTQNEKKMQTVSEIKSE